MAEKESLTNNQILLKECVQQEFNESSGYADVGLFFEHFAISQVLKNYNVSDDEIDNGNVGGANDGGCDGIYIFLNDELVSQDKIESLLASKGSTLKLCIFQVKYRNGFDEGAVMKWKTVSNNLLNISFPLTDYTNRYNESVIEAFSLFRDTVTKLIRSQVKLHIQYFYVTLGIEVHPNIKQQAEELKEIVNHNYPSAMVDVFFIGSNDLMTMYNSDSEIRIDLRLADQPISLSDKDYVGLVNLGTYYKFITDEMSNIRTGFFEANVRDYQGKNSVNTCIADTLENSFNEDFWWLNNGVTILASEITLITNKSLQLVNPEIVNGLQTSQEIFNYFSCKPSAIESEKRNILVRIVMPESEESRDRIIFATNNQTNIPKSSLRVTDPIHLQIEMYFKNRGLYYDRRKNYYKNQKKKITSIVGVSFLAQCLISLILRKPDFARSRPSTLLSDEDTYKMLYEENHDLEVFYNAALIGQKVKNTLRLSADLTSTERNDVLFYLIYAIVAKRLGKKKIEFADIKSFDSDSLSVEEINEVKRAIYQRYKELGGNARVARSVSFVDEVDTVIGI